MADGGSMELRLFDQAGRFLTSWGGQGGGPGEFSALQRIAVIRGDSIVARDRRSFDFVVFGPDGGLGRTFAGPPIVWNGLFGMFIAGWLEDGSFIMSHSVRRSEYPPGRSVIEQEWHCFDTEGEHVGVIARLPSFIANNEGRWRGPIKLGPRAHVEVGPTGFWHAFPRSYELRHYTSEGLDRIVRRTWKPGPLPDDARESYRRYYVDRLESVIARAPPQIITMVRARIEQMMFADTLPAFRTFLLSTDGHLWVEEQPSGDELSSPDWDWSDSPVHRRWSVFNPEGRWLGTVATPVGVHILEIGSDYVMGFWLDELDVHYLVLHRIHKPALSANIG